MENLESYIKPINEFRETQCQSDLLNGKIKIADVPFMFRGHDEYTAAHKYARGLVDEKESYYLYWKIAECMESDMVNLQAAVDIKNGRIPDCEPTLDIPEESEYFDLGNRATELEIAHKMCFENFPTRKIFF